MNIVITTLKILFIAQRIPYPANKGEKIRSFNQAKFLADLGHSIDVFAPIESEEEITDCEQLKQLPNFSCEYVQLPSKPLRLLTGLAKNESLSVANFYSKRLQQKVDSAIENNHYDAILCTSSAVAKYIFNSQVLNLLTKQPKLLLDYMDLDSDKWQQYASKASIPMKWVYQREAKLIAAYERKIQKEFDAGFFIADAEVNLFKQHTNDYIAASNSSPKNTMNNIHTLGNGMNTEEFYPATTPVQNDAPVFIFTGVMDYKPNVDAVVWFVEQCWPTIITTYPNAEFIIAGMNPNTAVMNLQKYNGITITGFVDEILPFYHKADYFVAPFRLARGVQNKVLQAFACGLPVISTPMGAEGIECKNDEHILLADTPAQFLEQIQRLTVDKALSTLLINNALTLINDEYSWQGKLAPLQAIIEQT